MALPDSIKQNIARAKSGLIAKIRVVEKEFDKIAAEIDNAREHDKAFPQTLTTNDRLSVLEKLERARNFLEDAGNSQALRDARLPHGARS